MCITRSNMHHYTWHCIPLHLTYLSLVNLISCFADLLIAFLRNLWLINIEHVVEECKSSKCCCWATSYVNCELLGWVDFNAGYSCGGSVGVGRNTRISSLRLCLEVNLPSTVWFGTHPLLLQIFIGYEPGFLLYLSFSSFPRLLGDLWRSCFHLSRLSSP